MIEIAETSDSRCVCTSAS